jgi:hypothetical protein
MNETGSLHWDALSEEQEEETAGNPSVTAAPEARVEVRWREKRHKESECGDLWTLREAELDFACEF